MNCYTCTIFEEFDTAQQRAAAIIFDNFGVSGSALLHALVGLWTAAWFINLMLGKKPELGNTVVTFCVFTFAQILVSSRHQYEYYITATFRNFTASASSEVVTSGIISSPNIVDTLKSAETSFACILGTAGTAAMSLDIAALIGAVLLSVPYVLVTVFIVVTFCEYLFILFIIQGFGPLIVICGAFKNTRSTATNFLKLAAHGTVLVLITSALVSLILETMRPFIDLNPASCNGGFSENRDFFFSERYFGVLIFGFVAVALLKRVADWSSSIIGFQNNTKIQGAVVTFLGGTMASAGMAGVRAAGAAANKALDMGTKAAKPTPRTAEDIIDRIARE